MYTKEMEPAKEHLTKALNFHKNDQSFITLGKILLLQGDINGAIGKVFLCFATIFFMAKTWLHTLTRASASFFPPLEFETPIPRGATRKYVKIPFITKII